MIFNSTFRLYSVIISNDYITRASVIDTLRNMIGLKENRWLE